VQCFFSIGYDDRTKLLPVESNLWDLMVLSW
jgi:hypothetical protein